MWLNGSSQPLPTTSSSIVSAILPNPMSAARYGLSFIPPPVCLTLPPVRTRGASVFDSGTAMA